MLKTEILMLFEKFLEIEEKKQQNFETSSNKIDESGNLKIKFFFFISEVEKFAEIALKKDFTAVLKYS